MKRRLAVFVGLCEENTSLDEEPKDVDVPINDSSCDRAIALVIQTRVLVAAKGVLEAFLDAEGCALRWA